MTLKFTKNEILRRLAESATAELTLALNGVKCWREQVARGLVKPEYAEGNIRTEERIIDTKRHILGFS